MPKGRVAFNAPRTKGQHVLSECATASKPLNKMNIASGTCGEMVLVFKPTLGDSYPFPQHQVWGNCSPLPLSGNWGTMGHHCKVWALAM